METETVMALQLDSNTCVTVGEKMIWAVAGDVVVDGPDGKRQVLHRIDFDQFVESMGYSVSGNMGSGWVVCRKV